MLTAWGDGTFIGLYMQPSIRISLRGPATADSVSASTVPEIVSRLLHAVVALSFMVGFYLF